MSLIRKTRRCFASEKKGAFRKLSTDWTESHPALPKPSALLSNSDCNCIVTNNFIAILIAILFFVTAILTCLLAYILTYHLPTYLPNKQMTDLLIRKKTWRMFWFQEKKLPWANFHLIGLSAKAPLVPNAPNNAPNFKCISSTENLLLRSIPVDWLKQVWGEYLRPIKRNSFLANPPKVFGFVSHQSPKGMFSQHDCRF